MPLKRKTKKKMKSGVYLELNGEVSIIERKAGKRAKREPLDGRLVLECVLDVLRRSLDRLES